MVQLIASKSAGSSFSNLPVLALEVWQLHQANLHLVRYLQVTLPGIRPTDITEELDSPQGIDNDH